MRRLLPLVLLASCAPRVAVQVADSPPFPEGTLIVDTAFTVRIGLADVKEITLLAPESLIVERDGVVLFQGGPGKWKVRYVKGKGALFDHYAVVETFTARADAESLAASLRADGRKKATVLTMGHPFLFKGDRLLDCREYAVAIGPFSTRSEALKAAPRPILRAVQYVRSPPSGRFRLTAPDGVTVLVSEAPISLHARPFATLFNLPTGDELHEGKLVTRSYDGLIEVRINTSGDRLSLVNELGLEDYLKGVLPAEMGSSFPLQALKAQAVLARCHAFSVMDKKLKLTGEPYHFTDDVFTQVYTGRTEGYPITDSAVEATAGEVLSWGGSVVWGVFFSSCGGLTESGGAVWGKEFPYLQPVPDGAFQLPDAEGLAAFLKGRPMAYCDTKTRLGPPGISWTAKNFRWTQTLTHQELISLLRSKAGCYLPRIDSIVVLERGPGYRVVKLGIYGGEKSCVLEGELKIRKSLAGSYLKSALFVVEMEGGRVKFYGGGFGHGVGMCQTGAGLRAYEGQSYEEILLHYFPGTVLEGLY